MRELARLTRDILVVLVDPSRVTDPELAAETERDRLKALASAFSAEDLMRAFEVLTKAEVDIRAAAYPRYHLEMALLRWIHLRRLVPISDLIDAAGGLGPPPAGRAQRCAAGVRRADRAAAASRAPPAPPPRDTRLPRPRSGPGLSRRVRRRQRPRRSRPWRHERKPQQQRRRRRAQERAGARRPAPVAPGDLKDAFLDEVRKSKKFFYGTVVAQAQRIDVEGDRVVFTFAPKQRALRAQLDQTRAWLDALASQLAGRRMTVVSAEGTAAARKPGAPAAAAAPEKDRQSELRQQALADSGVQAMLDVFAAEIKDVEEM